MPLTAFLPSSAAALDLNLDVPGAASLACARTQALGASYPRPELHLECDQLTCRRHLGVSHVVSQPLRLRRSGVPSFIAFCHGRLVHRETLYTESQVWTLPHVLLAHA